MANAKMTQKEMFAEVIKALTGEEASVSTDEMVEFIQGRIEVLSRKSGSRKPSKLQKENEVAKERIIDVLAGKDKGVRVADILAEVDFSDLSFNPSSQKISALLKQMAENDKTVVKTTDKKTSLFSLA